MIGEIVIVGFIFYLGFYFLIFLLLCFVLCIDFIIKILVFIALAAITDVCYGDILCFLDSLSRDEKCLIIWKLQKANEKDDLRKLHRIV